MSKLRILHVVPTYYPAVRYGGPIRSVHGLATALVQSGHEVHVATTSMDGAADLDVPLEHAADLDGVRVHYFRVPALRRLAWSPAMGTWLTHCVRRFDVVHLHSVFLWPTWAAARAARAAHVPYLIAPRGMLVRDVIRRRSRWVKTAWIGLIERATLRDCAGIHVTAELEAAEIAALGLPAPAVFCVPNGVVGSPMRPPRPAGRFAGIRQPYALFLSRINWKKGLDRLIAAWQWVPDLDLLIAGNDEERYQPELEALARSLGVADRVRFVGPASDAEKWGLFGSAELFVLPSYSENFGNVVAEAMAMGCPVIVSEQVGIAALVRRTGAGVVSGNAPRELAREICALHGDAARRRMMGANGQRAASSELSWDAIAGRMEAIYRQVMSPAQPPLHWARAR